MALETRPIPVLKGKAARDFFNTLENCSEALSRDEVQRINRECRIMIEEAKREEREDMLKREVQYG